MKKRKVGFEKYLTETLDADIESKELFLKLFYKQPVTTQLAMFRKGMGLSQVTLSNKAKLKQSGVARFEKAEANPRVQTIEKIAKALGAKVILATPRMIDVLINKELLAQGEAYFSSIVFGKKNIKLEDYVSDKFKKPADKKRLDKEYCLAKKELERVEAKNKIKRRK